MAGTDRIGLSMEFPNGISAKRWMVRSPFPKKLGKLYQVEARPMTQARDLKTPLTG